MPGRGPTRSSDPRLGRILRAWKSHVLARHGAHCISNGETEAINLLIEKTGRVVHDFRTFEHYRLRILLSASGTLPCRRGPAHALTPKSPEI